MERQRTHAILPEPGEIVAGRYRVARVVRADRERVTLRAHRLLDQGGPRLGEPVILQLLPPGAVRDRGARERFLRSVEVMSHLRGVHVARVVDVGTSEAPFVALEHLEGDDVASLLAERGPFRIEGAVECALQVCDALAEAHAAGIVHGDLAPERILVTRTADGSPLVKLLEFGASGDGLYTSPEQLLTPGEVDVRADIWGVGVLLYHLIAGEPPFDAPHVAQVCAQVLHQAPRPIRALRDGVPPDLEAIVFHCLEKDREWRYPSVSALAMDLLALRSSSVHSRQPPSERPSERPSGIPPTSWDRSDEEPVSAAGADADVLSWEHRLRHARARTRAAAFLASTLGILGLAAAGAYIHIPRFRPVAHATDRGRLDHVLGAPVPAAPAREAAPPAVIATPEGEPRVAPPPAAPSPSSLARPPVTSTGKGAAKPPAPAVRPRRPAPARGAPARKAPTSSPLPAPALPPTSELPPFPPMVPEPPPPPPDDVYEDRAPREAAPAAHPPPPASAPHDNIYE